MSDDITPKQARDEILVAAESAGVSTQWIEIVHEEGERRDVRMQTSRDVSSWRISLEIFRAQNGMKRYHHTRECATLLRQAVQRVVVWLGKGNENANQGAGSPDSV